MIKPNKTGAKLPDINNRIAPLGGFTPFAQSSPLLYRPYRGLTPSQDARPKILRR
jgi:hypothetical protein